MSPSTSPSPVIGIRAAFRRLKIVPFGLLWAVVLVLCALQVTEGQTLKADYRFQNSRSSTVGSSSLVDTGSNTFQSEIVDGITRTVLRFPFNNGLRLSPTTGILPSNSYTIAMLFKVDSVSGFVRLVDFQNRTSDNGLYIDNGTLENCTTCNSLAANTYVQVVYTRNSSGTFSGYLNGVLQGQGPDGGVLVIDANNVLNFFQDDLAFGGEASAGSVARIRLYDAPMTGAQVAALDREPVAATTFSVTNTNDSGLGSLRQAISDSNANTGTDTISFNIAGSGVKTITPLSALPSITDPVIIDGTTQPGFAGSPLIELNGTSAGAGTNGLSISAGNSTVRGLVINRFSGQGVILLTNGGNTIDGNFIGTNAQGTSSLPNAGIGIWIFGSPNNHIGSIQSGGGLSNLISGNGTGGFEGIRIEGSGATGNVVQGNRLGTNVSGSTALGNVGTAIFINGASNNLIGGTSAGAGNLISGSTNGHGIAIGGSNSTGNTIQGNFIGTNVAGTGAIANLGAGVSINGSNNTVGGTANGASNTIAFNGAEGIFVVAGTGNSLLSNSIFLNTALGIRLAAGANNNQSAPVLTSVQSFGGNTVVTGTLASLANKTFTIQFFANDTCDASGGGEGKTLIGSTSATTDGSGNASFNPTFGGAIPLNQIVTATATDPNNNTSAFSICRPVSVFNVSGHVADDSGNNLGGITLNLGGTLSTQVTSDGSGNYVFVNLPGGGSYTVTPASGAYSFGPASQTFNNLAVNRIANFVGTQTVVSISGKITDSSNIGINNVTVTLTKNGIGAGTVQTDVLGNYSFGNLAVGANYVVTPAGSFSPSSQTLSNLTVNATADFKAAPSNASQCSASSFAAASNFAVGNGAISIVSADFNGDGILDLATANNSVNNVSVVLGNGSGGFGAPNNFAVSVTPFQMVAGDFNSDGKLDLATASFDNVSILLGNGAGGFGAAANFAVPSDTHDIAAGDFNGDGKLDLVVTNSSANNFSILLGNGLGAFGAATNSALGNPAGVEAVDLNGDGKLDLVIANDVAGTISVLLGNGAGNFGSPSTFAAGTNPEELVIADLNSDGKPDVAVVDISADRVLVLLGNGSGGFGPATSFTAGATPFASTVSVGDLNGDGKLDMVVGNFNSANVSVFLGDGAGGFAPAVTFGTGTRPRAIEIRDFNGDGKADLAVTSLNTGVVSVLLNNGSVCNTQATLTISGKLTDASSKPLANVTVTLSGPISRVTGTDGSGNYSFANLVPGGNYAVTVQTPYFVIAPSRTDFFNLSRSQTANFIAAPVAVPLPSPPLADDFTSPVRDANKWTIGTQTEPAAAFDPQVTTAQVNGQLVITPRNQVTGLHYNGYVSAQSFDLTNGSASVEVVQAAPGGADTIFAIGSDSNNYYRFMVHTVGPVTKTINGVDGVERPLDTTVPQLLLQVVIAGQSVTLSLPYDPVQHRFMRFRYESPLVSAPFGAILFEGSPDDVNYMVLNRTLLQTRTLNPMTLELSAGTAGSTNTGPAKFDNVKLILTTVQFSAGNFTVGEGDGSVTVTVIRSGDLSMPGTVDYSTADGTALQRSKYIGSGGKLTFAPGQTIQTFSVLIEDNALAEGDETLNLFLTNPVGSGLNSPGRAVLKIVDNDTTLAIGNPLDDPVFFTTQQYYDFLSRGPDTGGLNFWVGSITQCGSDQTCIKNKRIDVSNAFFYEQEFQQTGAYVYRVYRVAYGNNQPFPNPDGNPAFPNENKKLPSYDAFVPDRARVVGGTSLAQAQLELANAFVQRPEFVAKYPSSLATGGQFVDAMLSTILSDLGVNLSGQRSALIDLYNQGSDGTKGRANVLYRLADDNAQTNPINNRALIDEEYVRGFVTTQYFGYLRRDADIGGLLFWLGQVSSAPLRDVPKQHAMVCSFITSTEYQQRFSPIATHANTECPQ